MIVICAWCVPPSDQPNQEEVSHTICESCSVRVIGKLYTHKERTETVLNFILQNPMTNYREISENLGLDKDEIAYSLKILRDKKLLISHSSLRDVRTLRYEIDLERIQTMEAIS